MVGRDCVVHITPLPTEQARQTLERLLRLWHQGMHAPLPLPPKTALAWLATLAKEASKAQQAARTRYEGSEQVRGDAEEPCMARLYPDFEALGADGQFAALAQEIYQPLLDWQRDHVTAVLYPKVGLDAADVSTEETA